MSRVFARVSFLILCALFLFQGPAVSQVIKTDTTGVRSGAPPSDRIRSGLKAQDTLRTALRDSVDKVDWSDVLLPRVLADSAGILGSHTRTKDPIEIYSDQSAFFRYHQGGFGMPSHLSPYRLAPSAVGFLLDGTPIEDPLTGFVDWDFLPLDYAVHESESASTAGRALGLTAYSRLITQAAPYTELKYFTGSNSLQSITAIHSQNRQKQLFGQPLLLNTSVHYRGGASDGEFTNSNYRHREIGTRILLAARSWYLVLDAKSGNHRNGVNGGVVELASGYDSIFDRFGASVNSSSDSRTKKRSQIKADFGLKWSGKMEAMRLGAYWQSNLNHFFSDTSFVAHMQIHGVVAEQDFHLGRHQVVLGLRAQSNSPGSASIWTNTSNELDLSISDRFELASSQVRLGASFGRFRGQASDALFASLRRPFQRIELHFDFRTGSRARYYNSQGSLLTFITDAAEGGEAKRRRDLLLSSGLRGSISSIDFGIEAYASQSDAIDFHFTNEGGLLDDALYHTSTESKGVGLGLDLAWNSRKKRGLYFGGRVDFFESSTTDFFAETIPSFETSSELGARYSLFQRELLMDSRLEFRSRSAASHVGLYSPTSGFGEVFIARPSQTQLNFWTDAEIRGATIFIGVENVLAPWLDNGSVSLTPYPLPDQAIRVGLLWPMDG